MAVPEEEWRAVVGGLHNVLFEGPNGAIDVALARLYPHLRTPTVIGRPPQPLDMSKGCGTLIVESVDALGGIEQHRLLQWLSDGGSATRVISATVRPLFPLVALGRFDAMLYYRLNTMLVRVG